MLLCGHTLHATRYTLHSSGCMFNGASLVDYVNMLAVAELTSDLLARFEYFVRLSLS